MSTTHQQLQSLLHRLDRRGYPSYKELRGVWSFPDFELHVDHVQGDPFAAPSRLRARVRRDQAGFATSMLSPAIRSVALRDYLARRFAAACHQSGHRLGSGKSGQLGMDQPGQEILERSSISLTPTHLEARFTAGLPAQGRRILGRAASELLCQRLPRVVQQSLFLAAHDADHVQRHLDTAEDAEALRRLLEPNGLVAFVADGACLPRRSGIDNRPLDASRAVPFRSPDSLRTTLHLPHAGSITGMGLPQGVTLIVGGGFHGKSTLLHALERGIYNHLPGDGREQVASLPSAVKVKAEDGRRVEGVDLRPFINNLPGGKAAAFFRTDNASGSTSQAANILEALEMGARLLLLDEDTCATNLLIRDARMQALVERSGEPITPFIDRIRTLAQRGVSTLLVLGGSGDYFEVADTVLRMDHFQPADVSAEARDIARSHPNGRQTEAPPWPEAGPSRRPDPDSLDPARGRREVHIKTRALRTVLYGTEEIDVSEVTQLVDPGQLRAIGRAIELARHIMKAQPGQDLATVIQQVMDRVGTKGLDVLDARKTGDYVVFRDLELAAAINRLRSLRVVSPGQAAPAKQAG